MEHIRLAIQKARERREQGIAGAPVARGPGERIGHRPAVAAPEPVREVVIPKLTLDSDHLEDRRVVSYQREHPSHIAFDMLRTQVAHAMREHGWSSIAVTSPTPGCGKTLVSLNLAFSMAQEASRKVALVDLDLRNPQIAQVLGYAPEKDMIHYLQGEADFARLFVQVGDNLLLALNGAPVSGSAEWMRDERITTIAPQIKERFAADIVIFDLSPALASDDVMVFSPFVDCAILVAAAGQTTAREIEDGERQLLLTNYLGVVLNKVPDSHHTFHGYGGKS